MKKIQSIENGQALDQLAADIYSAGYAVLDDLVPAPLLAKLSDAARSFSSQEYKAAGIGRKQGYVVAPSVRSDRLKWIDGDDALGQSWNAWLESLKQTLNGRLLLGLFAFESHFAIYEAGSFYKTHRDAFAGQGNRKLSVVLYLNKNWRSDDGGELVLYADNERDELIRVSPEYGRLVIFLSEEFPHEVRPARRTRYSIAAWFRVNTGMTPGST